MNSYARIELLLLVSAILVYPSPRVQASACYFTAMDLFGPPSVLEGERLEVHTLFSVTCPGGGYYLIRCDLQDGRTAQVLSTSRMVYATAGPVAAELANDAVAPKIPGWWSLQMNLYVLDLNGSPVAPQSQQLFGVTINPAPTFTIVVTFLQ